MRVQNSVLLGFKIKEWLHKRLRRVESEPHVVVCAAAGSRGRLGVLAENSNLSVMPTMEHSVVHSEKTSVPKGSKSKSLKRKRKTGVKKASSQIKYEPLYSDVLDCDAKDENELEYEDELFGDDDNVTEDLNKKIKKKLQKTRKQTEDFFVDPEGEDPPDDFFVDRKGEDPPNDFFIDHAPDNFIIDPEGEDSPDDFHENGDSKNTKKEVWKDEDDDNFLVQDKAMTLKNCHRSVIQRGGEKYKDYVKEKFIKVMGEPKWASTSKESEPGSSGDELEDELLQKAGNYICQSKALPKGIIDIKKCHNFTDDNVKMGIIKSTEFHPTSKVALVAGFSGTATLFQVDGQVNPKIQSVHFERFPIHTAHFTVDGEQIVVGSREYGHFFSYDMISGKTVRVPWEKDMDQMNVRRFHMSPDGKLMVIHGKYGNIHLLTAKTKEWVGTLKMNGEVYAIAFNNDGSQMFTHGDAGQIYVWDMSSRACIHRFSDQGCVMGTSLAVSPNQKFLASGSDCGIVNIYEMSNLLTSRDPDPLKALMNLTTEVTSLKFNCTSEILAMASSHKPNSIKLVHSPSMSVFSNFPVANQYLRQINSLDISLNSGFLAFGNNTGRAFLYRVKHYGNY